MKILITGGNGQLGKELCRVLRDGRSEIGPIDAVYGGAEVVSTDVTDLDIVDAASVMSFCHEGLFDLIINCAAMTNVDGCEAAEATAYRVNAEAPGNLARAAQVTGAKLVHVSTDYVFAGNEPGERIESDPVGPASAYGRTKLAGERLVREGCERSFVVRTAWLYGYRGKNFVKTMKNLGSSRGQVTVVNDQLGNPTSANDLAYEILKIANTDEFGIYHCTNQGTCSWAEFAQAIMGVFALSCEVVPCTSAAYKEMNPESADRPAFSSLRNKHLEDTVGDEMRPWREALLSYAEHFEELNG